MYSNGTAMGLLRQLDLLATLKILSLFFFPIEQDFIHVLRLSEMSVVKGTGSNRIAPCFTHMAAHAQFQGIFILIQKAWIHTTHA